LSAFYRRRLRVTAIEMLKHHALRQAMKALQHEISLSQAKANARGVRW
jgi:hypothetical protein